MKQEKEPAAIRELHRIRQEIRAEEKRVGSDKYWAEANRQGKDFARRHGLKYVESPSSAYILPDKPTRK
jgi:threonyl-tRNA synthetase